MSPPKKARLGLVAFNFRMDPDIVAELDEWVVELNKGRVGPQWSRSDLIRALLRRDVAERRPIETATS